MHHSEANELLRMIFDSLEKEGYKKRDMCNLTLGNQCSPMFTDFLKGKDLGIRPLSRIIDAFGYDLHLVPVPKKGADSNLSATLDTASRDFIENCKIALIENLSNEDITNKAKNKSSGIFKDIAQDLLGDVLK